IREILRKNISLNYLEVIPEKTIFVNFNYTDTNRLYRDNNKDIQEVAIHGSLSNPANIIFGYGDENANNIKDMENSKIKEFMSNIKSTKYLISNKYKDVLNFLELDDFQIIILGHSLSLSDKTLLKTLFEHPNCISIKPLYFMDENGNDNYNDLVSNLSRVFDDKSMLRDRVVSKELSCAYKDLKFK
ncbi:MAG: AbiH family protein, partial [Nitrososphaeraceae archaeon]|nr:AbiH family protein [Nitrososphaeraceae archaeon]